MDRREQRIADRLNDASATRQEAEKEKKQYRQKSEQLEQEKKSILEKATEQAETKRKKMQRQIRREMEEVRRRWQQELAKQQQNFLDELSRRAHEQIMRTAARTLEDLADQDLQERMTRVFINKLKNLDQQVLAKLRRSMEEEQPSIAITGAFEIDGSSRQLLTRTVHEVLGENIAVNYRQDKYLVAGLELNSSNEVVAWSLKEYFSRLREEIAGFIRQESVAEQQAGDGKEGYGR